MQIYLIYIIINLKHSTISFWPLDCGFHTRDSCLFLRSLRLSRADMDGWSLFTWSRSEVDVLGAGVGAAATAAAFVPDPDDPEDEGVTTILEVDTL